MHVEGCRGTVLRSVRGAVRASLSTQRSRMMLLASLSTDFGFNAILPQVIIANKTQFPIKFMKSLDPAITDRLKNLAWCHHGILLPSCVPIYVFYMRGGNLTALKNLWRSSSIVLHATSILLWGHWPKHWVASPGGTGTLQPLDAHIFRRQWTQTKSEAAEGVVPEKHGYVWWKLQWGHCLRIEIGSGLLKELEWPSSRIAYRRIIEPCNGWVSKIPAGRAPCIFPSLGAGSGNIEAWWKSALVMTA